MSEERKERKFTNPMRAIRAKCLDCSADSSKKVELCDIKNCPLYPFRSGRNPYRAKRELTEEQKAAAVKRLAEARAKKEQ